MRVVMEINGHKVVPGRDYSERVFGLKAFDPSRGEIMIVSQWPTPEDVVHIMYDRGNDDYLAVTSSAKLSDLFIYVDEKVM